MLSIIVAVAQNGVIGRSGDLPWKLSADLNRFKKITMGHHLIMGRKTYESIGRPLPGRTMIVLTTNRDYHADGCFVAFNLQQAIEIAKGDSEIFVVGGAQIYRSALSSANRLYWTQVDADVFGDTYFPTVDWDQWDLVTEESFPMDDKNQFGTHFRIYDRLRRSPDEPRGS